MLVRLFGLVGLVAGSVGMYFSAIGNEKSGIACMLIGVLIGVLACIGARYAYNGQDK